MAAANLRFGAHATREVGMDLANMIKQLPASERSQAKIGVFTDPNVVKLNVMKVVEESLMREGLNWVVWDQCSVEPTDHSWQVGRSLLHNTFLDIRCRVILSDK
jgi:hydroxyacid-oxoacid transhydrogenase